MVSPVSVFFTLSLVELEPPRSLNVLDCFLNYFRIPQ